MYKKLIFIIILLMSTICYAGDGSLDNNAWKFGQGMFVGSICRAFELEWWQSGLVMYGLSHAKECIDKADG